jgi:hypothetical protein
MYFGKRNVEVEKRISSNNSLRARIMAAIQSSTALGIQEDDEDKVRIVFSSPRVTETGGRRISVTYKIASKMVN